MIPKIIHYCWFGGYPLPDSARRCIESWKRNCPEYEIKEWNEDSFDINSHPFVKECYKAKKFGFIVDVLRTYVLKEYGGIYLDTDTEIIKPFEESMLKLNAFISYEDLNYPNVGLVASEKNGILVNEVYNLYTNKHFLAPDGSMNINYTGPIGFSEVLKKRNIKLDGIKKSIEGYCTLYPKEYFCAKSYRTGLVELTSNTYAIHHYDASWLSKEQKIIAIKNQHVNRLKEAMSYLKQNSSDVELLNFIQYSADLSIYKLLRLILKKTIKKFLKIAQIH